VETLFSGLSAGTELSFVKGTNPYLQSRWDAELGVFVEGQPAQSFPVRSMGYMEVGRVVETADPELPAGALVAAAYGHRSCHVLDPRRDRCVPVPPELDPMLGIYLAQMGPICANGLLHAAAEFEGPSATSLADGVAGRRVLVTGGGVVGLLSGLFALTLGAEQVALADVDPTRLGAAGKLGMSVVDERDTPAWAWCKRRWRHGPADTGADLVLQCRGQARSLQTALRSLRPQGVVIDLAFYQQGATEVRLGKEFHHNGLAIRCAQIARVPRGMAGAWDRTRLSLETLDLVRACGEAVTEHLVTDVVPIDEAPRFIAELAARERSAIQAVFDYTGSTNGAGST
jgi:threonine dehydrogenase-like Zn-dependent dehydrogenase